MSSLIPVTSHPPTYPPPQGYLQDDHTHAPRRPVSRALQPGFDNPGAPLQMMPVAFWRAKKAADDAAAKKAADDAAAKKADEEAASAVTDVASTMVDETTRSVDYSNAAVAVPRITRPPRRVYNGEVNGDGLDYIVICGQTIDYVVNEVNKKMVDGYILQGGISFNDNPRNRGYIQALVKYPPGIGKTTN